ncbi:MAG: histidine phosphatase family protein [Spirochaetaceae bacterium]|nr:histidine phosphatase family protein [Spirochaetaceae bacterium]
MSIDFSALARCGVELNFFLLRHGKSEGNAKDIVQGHMDYPLSEEGKEQAKKTADHLADKNIRAVLCSPLSRAAQTAAIVAAEAGLAPPRPLPELMEMDTGAYTGLTLEAAREKYPAMWPRFQAASWEGVDGAETINALRTRAEAAWRIMIREAAALAESAQPAAGEGRIGVLAVSHAGFLQWLIKALDNGASWFPLFPMGHCGIYQLSVSGTLIRWNLLNFQAAGVTGKR